MKLHLNEIEFKNFLQIINKRSNIDIDIIEKDYYVCLVLEELSKKQNQLKAYFKGGTAVYKILEKMNRFSEDIDLTVKILDNESKTKNINRLKKSALGYKIRGLDLVKEECLDKKGSITGVYRYNSVYKDNKLPLQRAGKIQVEATSFTVSEPSQKYNIEPLLYKLANDTEKNILEKDFEISKIEIEIVMLERMFIDKIFATEFYYVRNMYMDVAKHLYDIVILYNNDNIQRLLNNKNELEKLIEYKRREEKARKGGIADNKKIKNFEYFKMGFNNELINKFEEMQEKYVLNEEYKISIEKSKEILMKLYNQIIYYWYDKSITFRESE